MTNPKYLMNYWSLVGPFWEQFRWSPQNHLSEFSGRKVRTTRMREIVEHIQSLILGHSRHSFYLTKFSNQVLNHVYYFWWGFKSSYHFNRFTKQGVHYQNIVFLFWLNHFLGVNLETKVAHSQSQRSDTAHTSGIMYQTRNLFILQFLSLNSIGKLSYDEISERCMIQIINYWIQLLERNKSLLFYWCDVM